MVELSRIKYKASYYLQKMRNNMQPFRVLKDSVKGRTFLWLKANRKVLNAGKMKPERVEDLGKLLEFIEKYRRKSPTPEADDV